MIETKGEFSFALSCAACDDAVYLPGLVPGKRTGIFEVMEKADGVRLAEVTIPFRCTSCQAETVVTLSAKDKGGHDKVVVAVSLGKS